MSRHIGIYSGTFDPVHRGHIAFAEEAMRLCELDEVVFIPEQRPRGKERVTDIVHRIALLECTTSASQGLCVMRLDSEQFTVEQTLPELHRIFGDSDLTLLVGSDVVRTFLYRWEGLATLLADVSFAVGIRSSDSRDEVTAIIKYGGARVRYSYRLYAYLNARSRLDIITHPKRCDRRIPYASRNPCLYT